MKKNLLLAFLIAFAFTNAQNLEWVRSMGGTNYDIGKGVTVDASGNVYTVGFFNGTVDLDPSLGTFNVTSQGNADIFITKLDANGSFLWAKTMGGTGTDVGHAIVVDTSGNIYFMGVFSDMTDFDPGFGTFNLTPVGLYDIFISKLDVSGNFVWAKRIGNASAEDARTIFVDANNVYVTGWFYNTVDFDPGIGVSNLTSTGGSDVFILKLDLDGSYIWAKNLGGTVADLGYDVAVDTFGNVYTTGQFQGTADFDPSVNSASLISKGGYDVFISKLDASGNYVWAKSVGGTGIDAGNSLTVDATGNVCIVGSFEGTSDFDPSSGTTNLTSMGSSDIFALKLDDLGNYIWAKSVGGSAGDAALSVQTDVTNHWYLMGYYSSSVDFDPGLGTNNLTSNGAEDVAVLKLDNLGNYVWAVSLGGSGSDQGNGLTVDAVNNLYVIGQYQNTADFDPSAGVLNLTSLGIEDVFVYKMNQTVSSITQNDLSVSNIHLYPNPTSGVFQLNTTENLIGTTLQIYNVFGQLVLKQTLTENNPTIHFKGENGIYFVKITNNNKLLFTTNIIKQ